MQRSCGGLIQATPLSLSSSLPALVLILIWQALTEQGIKSINNLCKRMKTHKPLKPPQTRCFPQTKIWAISINYFLSPLKFHEDAISTSICCPTYLLNDAFWTLRTPSMLGSSAPPSSTRGGEKRLTLWTACELINQMPFSKGCTETIAARQTTSVGGWKPWLFHTIAI